MNNTLKYMKHVFVCAYEIKSVFTDNLETRLFLKSTIHKMRLDDADETDMIRESESSIVSALRHHLNYNATKTFMIFEF